MKQLKLAIGNFESTEFYIEICNSNAGVMSAYVSGFKLNECKTAAGYGYNKESTMLANVLNTLIGEKLVNSMNSGVAYVIEQAAIHGIKIETIAATKSGRLFKFTNGTTKMTNLEKVA